MGVNIMKRIHIFLKKYTNGTKGAISLFLAFVISPLLSVSLVLVESARYQNAAQLMQEITNTSAFSALADYDSYLDERFGLLATSQETNINAAFSDYLGENINALGNSVSLNSQSASGQFPLSDTDILKQQVLEYGEISVAAQMAVEGFDLDDQLKKLSKALGLNELDDEIAALEAGAEVAAEVAKLVEAVTNAIKKGKEYEEALEKYEDAYDEFEVKAVNLAEALKAAEKAQEEAEEGEETGDIYDDDAVKKALQEAKEARDTYKDATETLKKKLSEFHGKVDTIYSVYDNMPSKLDNFHDKATGSADTTDTYDWLLIIVDELTSVMKWTDAAQLKDAVGKDNQLLQSQINELNAFQDKTVDSSWEKHTVKSKYGSVDALTFQKGDTADMEAVITKLNDSAEVSEDGTAMMGGLLDITSELLGIDGLYDPSLDSIVSSSGLYNKTNISKSSWLSLASLTALVQAGEDFSDSLNSKGLEKLVGVLKALGKLLVSLAAFLAAVVVWAVESLCNLASFLFNPSEYYNSLLLYGYGTYNMPNRVTYPDGKTLAGYSYSKVFDLAGGIYSDQSGGSLKDIAEIQAYAGTDKMFKGAATEYLLIGSESEIYNQSCTFFDLYLFRLLLNLKPILTNKEVTAMAAAAGPGYWVVKIAVLLSEPMLDTIVVVNGGNQFLYKKTIYLTPSGIACLVADISDISHFSKSLKKSIKETIKSDNTNIKKKGVGKASYTEHMLLLMVLSVSPETYMQRLQNLIQMEAAVKYENQYTYDIEKSYTYIYSDVNYTLNPMFNLDGLTDNKLFTGTNKQYSGY